MDFDTKSVTRRAFAMAAAASAMSPSFLRQASAQSEFPTKAVQLVVPFAPGGATDALARQVAVKLSRRWRQPVVVDNRPGATGAIAAQFVARAPADGYTLLVGTASVNSVAPAVNPRLPYKASDFSEVSLLATFPNLLVVHPSVAATSVSELIALLKARPGKMNYASTGAGGSVHLAAELFKQATGTDMVHIPFKGSGVAITELLAGRVELAFDNIPAMLPYVRSGKLRALGVTSPRRVPSLADIPAVAETVPGFDATTWVGILAPSGVDSAVLHKISADLHAIVNTGEFVGKMASDGATAVGGTPEAFARFLQADTQKWARVVKSAGITAAE